METVVALQSEQVLKRFTTRTCRRSKFINQSFRRIVVADLNVKAGLRSDSAASHNCPQGSILCNLATVSQNELIELPSELAKIVAVWPELPGNTKAEINALVKPIAVKKPSSEMI
jgi:hypothetical protein